MLLLLLLKTITDYSIIFLYANEYINFQVLINKKFILEHGSSFYYNL